MQELQYIVTSTGDISTPAQGFVPLIVTPVVGTSVGAFVGVFVGMFVGVFVGAFVGAFVGVFVGACVGASVGAFVGAPVAGAPCVVVTITPVVNPSDAVAVVVPAAVVAMRMRGAPGTFA